MNFSLAVGLYGSDKNSSETGTRQADGNQILISEPSSFAQKPKPNPPPAAAPIEPEQPR
jgi:hypothetical protein